MALDQLTRDLKVEAGQDSYTNGHAHPSTQRVTSHAMSTTVESRSLRKDVVFARYEQQGDVGMFCTGPNRSRDRHARMSMPQTSTPSYVTPPPYDCHTSPTLRTDSSGAHGAHSTSPMGR